MGIQRVTGGIPINVAQRGNGPRSFMPVENPQAELANKVISANAKGSIIKEADKVNGPGINNTIISIDITA